MRRSQSRALSSVLVGVVLLMAGCNATSVPGTAGVTPSPTAGAGTAMASPAAGTSAASATPAGTGVATAAATQAANATAAPATATPGTAAPVEPLSPVVDKAAYVDDRSGPVELLQSFVNALNRKEYARAYSYWSNTAAAQLPAFPQFQQGYAKTDAVNLTIGPVTTDVGAGQIYYRAAAALKATNTDGTIQTFVGCYAMHLANPGIQDAPPFLPLSLENATVKQVDNGADLGAPLVQACEALQPMPNRTSPQSASGPAYMDNRSGPGEVVASFVNALNHKEYLRAYSYWESGSQVPAYAQFKQGYADTASVELITGTVGTSSTAGQVYYTLPLILKAKTTSGAAQVFVGCYTLHLSRADIQTTPPFVALSIAKVSVQQVADEATAQNALGQACK
jgi:hypothetical protein